MDIQYNEVTIRSEHLMNTCKLTARLVFKLCCSPNFFAQEIN